MKPSIPGFPIIPPQPGFWRDLWRQKKLALVSTPRFKSAGTYWNNQKNVTDFYARSRTRQSWQENVNEHLKVMHIPAGARVLDIGGGSGTHAIPLAANGCDVTIVEPSVAMREELDKNLASSGTGPIAIIPFRWEDVPLSELGGPFDAVIASYSLSMMEIGEALEKMQACCRGTVHLFWFLTPPSWARVSRDLWPLFHEKEFPGEPLADCLWQVLYEMGIYANLPVEQKKATVYRTADEVVLEYYHRLDCSTESQKTILKAYFAHELQPCSGGFVLKGASHSAHIWWNTGDQLPFDSKTR